MTHYAQGYNFERAVTADLVADGYRVIPSRGSHGIVDLAGFKYGQVLAVQCKRSDPQISPAERAALLEWAAYTGAVPIVASRVKVGRRFEVRYRRLTGPGPKAWEPWTADDIASNRTELEETA